MRPRAALEENVAQVRPEFTFRVSPRFRYSCIFNHFIFWTGDAEIQISGFGRFNVHIFSTFLIFGPCRSEVDFVDIGDNDSILQPRFFPQMSIGIIRCFRESNINISEGREFLSDFDG